MMCCKKVKVKDQVYYENSLLAQWQNQFEALKLQDVDIEKLFEAYNKIDQDGSGSISLWEMLEHLKLPRSKFTKRVFSIMDEDGSGEIDFREFVIALWNYCTLGKAALILFAFDLYDNDSSGKIDIEEIKLMLREVYGKEAMKSTQATAVMGKIAEFGNAHNGDEEVNKEQFSDFVRRNPALLYPAFQLQQVLQKQVLGMSFWDKLSSTRVELSNGNFMSVNALLQMQINKEAFHALVQQDDGATPLKDQGRFYHATDGKRKTNHAEDAVTAANTGIVADRRKKAGVTIAKTKANAVNAFGKGAKKGKAESEADGGDAALKKATGKLGKKRGMSAAAKVVDHYKANPHAVPKLTSVAEKSGEAKDPMSYEAYKNARQSAGRSPRREDKMHNRSPRRETDGTAPRSQSKLTEFQDQAAQRTNKQSAAGAKRHTKMK